MSSDIKIMGEDHDFLHVTFVQPLSELHFARRFLHEDSQTYVNGSLGTPLGSIAEDDERAGERESDTSIKIIEGMIYRKGSPLRFSINSHTSSSMVLRIGHSNTKSSPSDDSVIFISRTPVVNELIRVWSLDKHDVKSSYRLASIILLSANITISTVSGGGFGSKVSSYFNKKDSSKQNSVFKSISIRLYSRSIVQKY